jgi:glycosyltransferase involved in cell wall biosynthesis
MTRTLLISDEVLGAKMAGPGIRYYQLSRVLSRHTDLTLAIVPQDRRALAAMQARLPNVKVIGYRRAEWDTLKQAAEWAEIVMLPPLTIGSNPQFLDFSGSVIIDGYNPLIPEFLTTHMADAIEEQLASWSEFLAALYNQYLVADFIICASERQRYWWIGQLEVAGRINPHTLGQDPSLRALIDVVPYGLPQDRPQKTRAIVRGVWPGIERDDVILLWGGGLWPWLDALTAVQAVCRLRESHPRLKLIFPGTIHPNQQVADSMPLHETKSYQYASEHGLIDSSVFFGKWVPYEDWQSVLLESDIALSLHYDSLETQLAFRSRMLEYFWAGLPVIATIGDATSEMVKHLNLGQVVDYQDVDGVIQAIADILEDKSVYQAGFARAQRELTWEKAAEPLIRFCQDPYQAADRGAGVLLEMDRHERKIRELESLVIAYQSGKVMRLMNRVRDMRLRWKSWLARP